MKVLFVGDGPHEIGAPSFAPIPRQAAGVVSTLCQKMRPSISDESIALSWTQLSLFSPRKRLKNGYDRRLTAAKELAAMKFGCVGVIAVVDQDRDSSRIDELRAGQSGIYDTAPFPVAVGTAVESIEAWTLGDPNAIAETLGVSLSELGTIHQAAQVESFYQNSGKPELRPKGILQRIADLKHRKDTATWRTEIAERADLARLEKNCPIGFAPFAQDVRQQFPGEVDPDWRQR